MLIAFQIEMERAKMKIYKKLTEYELNEKISLEVFDGKPFNRKIIKKSMHAEIARLDCGKRAIYEKKYFTHRPSEEFLFYAASGKIKKSPTWETPHVFALSMNDSEFGISLEDLRARSFKRSAQNEDGYVKAS